VDGAGGSGWRKGLADRDAGVSGAGVGVGGPVAGVGAVEGAQSAGGQVRAVAAASAVLGVVVVRMV
jgi:hypothetical protein